MSTTADWKPSRPKRTRRLPPPKPNLEQLLPCIYNPPVPTERGRSIRIDDHNSNDVAPDFCHITVAVDVAEKDRFTLKLHPAPLTPELAEFVESTDGETWETPTGAMIAIELTTKDAPTIRKLATAVRRVTGRGKKYPNPNWKWICRRTAASLELFAYYLGEIRRGRVRMLTTKNNKPTDGADEDDLFAILGGRSLTQR